jgi:hypothetical protein
VTPRPLRGWTDCPFAALGDTPGREASLRRVTLLEVEEPRRVWCRVLVEGLDEPQDVKRWHLYSTRRRAPAGGSGDGSPWLLVPR